MVKEEVVIKKEEMLEEVDVKEEREEVECRRERVLISELSNFMLRDSHYGANSTSTQPHSISPFSVLPPPLFTLCSPFPDSTSTVLPDACCKLGALRGLSMLGPNHPNIGCPVAELWS